MRASIRMSASVTRVPRVAKKVCLLCLNLVFSIRRGVIENPDLTRAYYVTNVPVINLRIAQAGVRLASFLNAIFG